MIGTGGRLVQKPSSFDVQEAADLYQAVHLHTLEDLGENGPYPKVISQLALRIITYEYPLEAIFAIYYLSATGYFASQVSPWPVEWSGQMAWWHQTYCHYLEWSRVGRCQNHTFQIGERGGWGGIPAWGGGMVERTELPFHHPRWLHSLQLSVVPGEKIQRHLSETLHVEAGLRGGDLLYSIPWDISIRSDKEGTVVLRTFASSHGRNCWCLWHLWRHGDSTGYGTGQE